MKLIPLILLLTLIPTCQPAFAIETPDWDRLVPAIIEVESNGNPNAYSGYAYGLMQVSSIVLKEYAQVEEGLFFEEGNVVNVGKLYDPSFNIMIGSWYLKRLYHYYKCPSIEHILAAYNGGITRLRKNNWDIDKMPRETRNYVKCVMKLYNQGDNNETQ